jgi:hypothetical protein
MGMIAAAHPGAKTISKPKLPAKEASPKSATSHEARLKVAEKNNLNMPPASG